MKHIRKQSQPQEFIEWVHGDWKDPEGRARIPRYDDENQDMTGEVHEALLKSLAQEQGYICCYTGISITSEVSHVEHIYPQSCSKRNGTHEDIDYGNMLAAYPGPNSKHCPYGAVFRGDWYDKHLFVHPLYENCEQRFRYTDQGKVTPTNPDDQGAVETIKNLNLNHDYLVKLRRRRIYELLKKNPPTKARAKRLMTQLDQRDSNGRFLEFCFVLKQVCEKYLKRFDKPR